MSRSKHTEAAIIAALKQVEAGRKARIMRGVDTSSRLGIKR